MDWNSDYTVAYYACLVDRVTWKDSKRFTINGGDISRVSTNLKESAELISDEYEDGADKYIRIWMDAEQDGDYAHEALFTGLTSTPIRQYAAYGCWERTIDCYSVLKPAQDVYLKRGWYAAKGFIGADLIRTLLSVCHAPVEIAENSPRLADHIIAENGETNLSMAYKILESIGWRLRITGYGIIQILPQSSEPVAIFSAIDNDMLETGPGVKNDWFECPNVFRAVSDSDSVVVYDDAEDSPLSTVNRGREVWKEESGVKLSDTESLRTYAERRLEELQKTSVTVEYDRSYHPDVLVTDCIRLHYPAQDLDGIFAVESQSITLDHCGTTSEEVVTA